jgi:probable F420-dependent oxidoreductase
MARKPFRFGLIGKAQSREEWIEQAKKAEELGYASFLASDHVYWEFSPIAALQAAASATTTLRIGSNVFCNDFWHPVQLAREAATLDVLSGGRFELGIGAGYFPMEYAQAGIPFASAQERIARLEEAVQVITGLFREEPLTFSGHYYTIQGLRLPQTLRRPRPPLYMGGGGKLMLSAAARHADIVGLVPRALPNGFFDMGDSDQAGIARKVTWVREAAGARFEELELSLPILTVALTEKDRLEAVKPIADLSGVSAETLLESMLNLVGSEEQICEQLVQLRERYGFSYITTTITNAEQMAPIVARLAGH